MFLPISPYTGGLQTLAGPTKGNRLETADAQNVWLKLVDHLGRLRGPAALSGWLATTTRRNAAASCTLTRKDALISTTAAGAPAP